MFKYPMSFAVKSSSVSGIQTAWRTQAKSFDHEIPLSIPPEFEGPGLGLSPEDLYAMALQNCFMATFKVFAEKSKLQYDSVGVETVLEVDRDEKGHPWMARIHLHVTLKGAVQEKNAQRILEKTSQSCMILNSVNTQKSFQFDLVP
jgi:organic hydroperoxide reductase OsmC/OhrA